MLASIASLLFNSLFSCFLVLISSLAALLISLIRYASYASRPAPAPAPAPSLPPHALAIRFIRFAFSRLSRFLSSNNYSLAALVLYTPTPLLRSSFTTSARARYSIHSLQSYQSCASYYLRTRSFHSIRFAFSAPTPLIYRLSSNINSFNPFASNRLILLF